MRLTNAQWSPIAPLIVPPRRSDGRGRPPQNLRPVVDGILWVLQTGARWRDLPREYPPYQTCWRWFDRWSREGTWQRVRGALLRHLDESGSLNWEEGFIDAIFSPAKKGGPASGPTKRGKGTKIMAVVDGHGLPLATTVHSASPAEVTLAPAVFARIPSKRRPRRIIGDKAYDCDALRVWFQKEYGVELSRPTVATAARPRTVARSDATAVAGRSNASLPGWATSIASSFAGSGIVHNFHGFVTLACLVVLLRHL